MVMLPEEGLPRQNQIRWKQKWAMEEAQLPPIDRDRDYWELLYQAYDGNDQKVHLAISSHLKRFSGRAASTLNW
jgi:hypothetical protein